MYFDQINAPVLSIRHIFQKHLKILQTFSIYNRFLYIILKELSWFCLTDSTENDRLQDCPLLTRGSGSFMAWNSFHGNDKTMR